MEEGKSALIIFTGKKPIERSIRRWERNIRIKYQYKKLGWLRSEQGLLESPCEWGIEPPVSITHILLFIKHFENWLVFNVDTNADTFYRNMLTFIFKNSKNLANLYRGCSFPQVFKLYILEILPVFFRCYIIPSSFCMYKSIQYHDLILIQILL